MDISELQWHVKQENHKLIQAQDKLDQSSMINRRLKSDISFNKNHSPLVEEKLRLEEAAMVDITQEQEKQNGLLRIAKAKLKLGQEEFRRKSIKLRANREEHEKKLEKVCDTLAVCEAELRQKEAEADGFRDKIDSVNIQIQAQEDEIAELRKQVIT